MRRGQWGILNKNSAAAVAVAAAVASYEGEGGGGGDKGRGSRGHSGDLVHLAPAAAVPQAVSGAHGG